MIGVARRPAGPDTNTDMGAVGPVKNQVQPPRALLESRQLSAQIVKKAADGSMDVLGPRNGLGESQSRQQGRHGNTRRQGFSPRSQCLIEPADKGIAEARSQRRAGHIDKIADAAKADPFKPLHRPRIQSETRNRQRRQRPAKPVSGHNGEASFSRLRKTGHGPGCTRRVG